MKTGGSPCLALKTTFGMTAGRLLAMSAVRRWWWTLRTAVFRHGLPRLRVGQPRAENVYSAMRTNRKTEEPLSVAFWGLILARR